MTPSGETNGPDPDYYNTGPALRGRFRLSPVGIWWRHRYRRYSADRTHRLFVVRTRGIVIFPNYLGCAPESQVRSRLPAGGKWVRTLGPPFAEGVISVFRGSGSRRREEAISRR